MIDNIEFTNGYTEITITKWEGLVNIISNFKNDIPIAFRGEEDSSFLLQSSLHRLYPSFNQEILSTHLNNFKSEMRGRIHIPLEYQSIDDEMWAIGQHHGLATPLLDWSYSAYVSLYFAFYKTTSEDYVTLYALNLEAIEDDLLLAIEEHIESFPKNVLNDLKNLSHINLLKNAKHSATQAVF